MTLYLINLINDCITKETFVECVLIIGKREASSNLIF